MSDLTRVQSVYADGENPSAALPSSPTVNNLLVAVMNHRNGGASAAPTLSGFTLRAITHTTSDGGNKGVALFDRIVDGSETTFTSTGAWQALHIAEYATGGSEATFVEGRVGHSGSSSVSTFTRNVPAALNATSLAIAAAFHRATASEDDSPGDFDSGFGGGALERFNGSDFGINQLTLGRRNDVNGTPDGDVTWTNAGQREVAMAVGTWQLASSWTVSGTVTKDGTPVEGASVAVVAEQGGISTLRDVVETDANGDWSAQIPEGSVAHAMAYWDDQGTLHTAQAAPFIEEPSA